MGQVKNRRRRLNLMIIASQSWANLNLIIAAAGENWFWWSLKNSWITWSVSPASGGALSRRGDQLHPSHLLERSERNFRIELVPRRFPVANQQGTGVIVWILYHRQFPLAISLVQIDFM